MGNTGEAASCKCISRFATADGTIAATTLQTGSGLLLAREAGRNMTGCWVPHGHLPNRHAYILLQSPAGSKSSSWMGNVQRGPEKTCIRTRLFARHG